MISRNIFYSLLLLILASTLIFYQFPLIPQNISNDEVDFAQTALKLSHQPYTPYTPLATGHSTLYLYIIAASFKLFGINTFALRFPAALFGVIDILLYFLVIKKFFPKNTTIPFLGTVVLLTSRWYLNFARFSFEATFLLFLELLSIFFLFYYFWKDKKIYIFMSGLFAGLCFNSYLPGRIFFLLPLVIIFFQNSWKKSEFKFTLSKLFLFVLPFILTILPLTLYLSTHRDLRVQQLSYVQNKELSVNKKMGFFFQNASSLSQMFMIKGDINGRHNYPGKPALNPIMSAFLIIGLVPLILRLNTVYNQFFLLYFFISLIPALFTYPWENPNMLRTFTVLPFIMFTICLGIDAIYNFLQSKKNLQYLLIIPLIFLIASLVYELRTYFVFQTQVFPYAFEQKGDLKNIIK